MSALRVGINGFGRIGRMAAKVLLERRGVELVAVNDPADKTTLTHLFKYDSVHGPFKGEVSESETGMRVDGKELALHHEKEPASIPWERDGVDLVIDASGLFLTYELAEGHLRAGAERVILSAPPKDRKVPMVAYGIDHDALDGDEPIVSGASCTTNSAAPMIRLIDRVAGIRSGYITTVHSYTVDQRLHDAPHKDLRRARAAAESIVPTTTGAAKAITRIFPHLDLRMGGCGIRVPVPDGSLTDITCVVEEEVSAERIDSLFREAAENEMEGILRYNPDPIVSRDIIGDPHSCIYDAQLTSVIGGLVKLVGWYDNEVGYSNRLVDLAVDLGN
jgi:glyceraldehyde 3-phosphate dehydrogenase